MEGSYSAKGGLVNGTVYVSNLPEGTDENMLAEHFGPIGLLMKDKRTGRPKIWIYLDKETNEPKGDATVSYEDPHAAMTAVEWFNDKEFHRSIIGVHIADKKSKDGIDVGGNPGAVLDDGRDINGDDAMGRCRVDAAGKAWKQEWDWLCPNTSCSNVNFAFCGVCNRCGSARPSGSSGGSGAGGRGNGESGVLGRAATGSIGLFGVNDWPCPMCGNINWAKLSKCNICKTNKPGHPEGGVGYRSLERGGRGGGYKELDEEELEETKRRRREAEENDGVMYDEFGNLKTKFRAKSQQAEVSRSAPGAGHAGWEVEEVGAVDRDGKEKSRDGGKEQRDRDDCRSRELDERNRRRSCSRERDRGGRDRDYDYGKDRDYGRDRDYDRGRHRH